MTESAVHVLPAADRGRGGTTSMRCGGCGVAAEFAHGEPQYGRLVHHFLDQHERCGNAVQITPGPSPLLVSPLAS